MINFELASLIFSSLAALWVLIQSWYTYKAHVRSKLNKKWLIQANIELQELTQTVKDNIVVKGNQNIVAWRDNITKINSNNADVLRWSCIWQIGGNLYEECKYEIKSNWNKYIVYIIWEKWATIEDSNYIFNTQTQAKHHITNKWYIILKSK